MKNKISCKKTRGTLLYFTPPALKIAWRHIMPQTIATLLPQSLLILLVFAGAIYGDTVRINEFMASNGSTIQDEDGDYEDWIELYNYGSEAVDLSGWGLSDDTAQPMQWTFAEGTTIAAGQHLIVWASGKDRAGAATTPNPAEIDGLVLWMRASSVAGVNGTAVSVWQDESGRGNDATQATAGLQPTLLSQALNGRAALSFDRTATQQLLLPTGEFDGLDDFSDFSMFQVIRWGGETTSGLWGGFRGSNNQNVGSSQFEINQVQNGMGQLRLSLPPEINLLAPDSVSMNHWHVVGATMNSQESRARIRVDGEARVEGFGTVGRTLLADYEAVPLGSSFNQLRTFGGEIAEVILFNRELTDVELLGLEAYLAGRHALAFLPQLQPHTNFRISASGEPLQLFRPDGSIADSVPPVHLPRDIAYGRDPDAPEIWVFFYEPTPGMANSTNGLPALLEPVSFSVPSGRYTSPFSLDLTHHDPEAVVLYTTDGSEPHWDALGGSTYAYMQSYSSGPLIEASTETRIFENPILIEDRSSAPNRISGISSTADSNPNYLPASPIKKGTVVRARAYRNGAHGEIHTASYFVSASGAFDYGLPVINLSFTEGDLFDFLDGIYVAGVDHVTSSGGRICNFGNYNRRGSEAERSAHLHYWEDGQLVLDQPAGIRIQGNCSRMRAFKSLRLYARGTSDEESAFSYPFFSDPIPAALYPDNIDFNRLILRGPNFNDTVFSRLYQPVYEGVLGRVQPAIQFFNGEFWGLSFIRDRFDPQHLNHHYGLDPDNITIIVIRYPHEVDDNAPGAGNRRYAISSGIPSDMDDYIAMRAFVADEDMSQPARYAEAEALLDIDSFIDHLIVKIFAADDHYAPEFVFWRAREAENDDVGDGRWRAHIKDFDSTLRVQLGNLIEGLATGTAPRSFGHEMFTSLLDSPDFRQRFINRFGDLLNTHFRSDRFAQIIHDTYDEVSPYWSEVAARWNNTALSNPSSPFTLNKRNELLTYSQEQPARQRLHIREYFNLAAEHLLTVDNSHAEKGQVRLNRIQIDGEAEAFPFSGTYFQGVPIELEAQAQPGHRFVHWQVISGGGAPATNESETLTLSLTNTTSVEAVFEPIPLGNLPLALHLWDFEDALALLSPSFTIGDGALTAAPGSHPEWEAIANTGGDFETQHLRVNYPLGTTLTLDLPTTGYAAITLDFLTRRSGQGAGLMAVEYTTNGSTWTAAGDPLVIANAPPQAQHFDFSAIEEVADNPLFAVRFTFAQGAGGTAGNNRFDDVTLTGVALPETNLPPIVDDEAVPPVGRASADGAPLILSVDGWFIDPEDDALSYTAQSSAPSVATVEVTGSTLTVTPLATGETTISVSASDGTNAPVETALVVLVYPQAFALGDGAFSFTEWEALAPAGSFPDNMLFVQSEVNDPVLATPLNRAYHIPPADADSEIDADQPYNALSRSRINGLGTAGISFINTGRGRDVGAAVVALDTTGVDDIRLSFTTGTIAPNNRIYAIRLQSRIGLEGDWVDVLDAASQPIEYVRNANAGHVEQFGPLLLPASLEDQPLVFLRWFYHYQSGSGSRAELRLDDIVIDAGDPDAATELATTPLTFYWTQSGRPLAPLEVRAVSAAGATDINFNSTVTISLLGDGVLSGSLSIAAVNGVASFDDLVVTGAEGSFQLVATAPGLTATATETLYISSMPVLLPTGTTDWTENGNWTSEFYPHGAGASARILAAEGDDRNVNLHAPVTIGSLIVDNADSPHRNRLRDRSTGNTLTFNNDGATALLRIFGNSTGFVEFNNEAGTILTSDLRLEVENYMAEGDFGALRLREAWSGPGGLIKAGPGMATLTGDAKTLTGPVLIEQGVLGLSEPSVPTQASSIAVTDGGQLRLTSASSETEPVRLYTFGSPLSLAGQGRSGIPEGAGLGMLGALRYEPGSFDNTAEITTPVTITAAAGVHVSGENTLILSGALSGSGSLSKSGGGILALSPTPASFSGPIAIERGQLQLNGADLSANTSTLALFDETSLAGPGQWGGLIEAAAGSSLAFTFAGEPPASATIAAAALSIQGSMTVEVTLPEGLSGGHRLRLIQTSSITFAPGVNLAALSIVGADGFAIRQLEIGPNGLDLLLANTPFDLWRAQNFEPAALNDPTLSGPEAEALSDGMPNLLKYALGLTPFERVSSDQLDWGQTEDNRLFIRFYRDPNKTDIIYLIESSLDLADWSDILFDSSETPHIPNSDGDLHEVSIPIDGELRRFLRLRVTGP
ncbi:MAG: hypothetical protein EA353_11590 [Puniceicoccaceae bacterium]|nr:MAG: hypothetical protein EA353_11590 [Puniceicoccaceae bacterium]